MLTAVKMINYVFKGRECNELSLVSSVTIHYTKYLEVDHANSILGRFSLEDDRVYFDWCCVYPQFGKIA